MEPAAATRANPETPEITEQMLKEPYVGEFVTPTRRCSVFRDVKTSWLRVERPNGRRRVSGWADSPTENRNRDAASDDEPAESVYDSGTTDGMPFFLSSDAMLFR